MALHPLGIPSAAAAASRIDIPGPHLLFLGDVTEPGYAKTAFGLRDWAPERCVGQYACPEATVSLDLPVLAPAEAYAKGARSMIIGVANTGGVIVERWIPYLVAALEAGLDLVSGMHSRLENTPALEAAAVAHGRRLINVRHPPSGIPVASGRKRSGRRLLTVGTDCVLGKKYTALALTRAFHARGIAADFRATGQTGIMIAGGGMPMDAVVCDFEAGAAELLSPDAAEDHWDIIEGQGSLLHPAYASVSLGLLHGSQPDLFVVCHQPGRAHMLGLPGYRVPSVAEVIDVTLRLGRLTNPAIRCAGVSLNTSNLAPGEALDVLTRESETLGLPAADPMRGGPPFDRLIEACLT
jgi:D-glutamate N-acetyltransferase